MNDNDRKRLTEWLGECWHEEDANATAQQIRDQHDRAIWAICANCGEPFLKQQGRTFATPSDLWDLTQRLAYKGFWRMYLHFAEDAYRKEIRSALTSVDSFVFWMADPARCQTIADFLKERE